MTVSRSADDELSVVKRFPLDEFRVSVPPARSDYAEEIPDQLLLEHSSAGASLAVGLDLFEFIARSRDGLQRGSEEQGALLEDLVAFKNQLMSRPGDELVLIEGGRRASVVRFDDGKLVREVNGTC